MKWLGCVLAVVLGACSAHRDVDQVEDSAYLRLQFAAIDQYAVGASQLYVAAALKSALLNQATIAFVDDPTQEGFDDLRNAWAASHAVFLQTEALRFNGGPIEPYYARLNAWPINGGFIDYVVDDEHAGFVNSVDNEQAKAISANWVASLNEKDDSRNVSLGFHAIEFLLWGQDVNGDGQTKLPGQRAFTDYVDDGPNAHAASRRAILQQMTAQLAGDLATVASQWQGGANTYRERFLQENHKDAIERMFWGLYGATYGELYLRNLNDLYVGSDSQEEQSNFSDTTLSDLLNILDGIEKVYLGRYDQDLVGIEELVKYKDPLLDVQFKVQITFARLMIQSIPKPFDRSLTDGDDSAPGRRAIKSAVDATKDLGKSLRDIAKILGVSLPPVT